MSYINNCIKPKVNILSRLNVIVPFKDDVLTYGNMPSTVSVVQNTPVFDTYGVSGAYLRINLPFTVGFELSDWTMGGWWYWPNNITQTTKVFLRTKTGPYTQITYYSNGDFGVQFHSSGGATAFVSFKYEYTHLVLDSLGRFYTDGEYRATATDARRDDSTNTIMIGADHSNKFMSAGVYWRNIFVQSSVLSANEIKEIYELGNDPYNL
jgi:hypothetical protein